MMNATASTTPQTKNSVADEFRSLIPAEVTAVFLTLHTNIENTEDNNIWFFVFAALLAVVSVPYTRTVVKSSWPRALLVSFIVFPAWSLMIAYERIDFFAARPFIVTGIMLILGLLVPVIAAAQAVGSPPSTAGE